jgi:hypothetical protein
MQKWSVEPEGVLDIDETMTPKRELYIGQMLPVTLEYEAHKEEAYNVINTMPAETLPQLPRGYVWARNDGKHSIIRHTMADEHKLKLILYGPNAAGQINFLFQVDGVTHYSFAHTRRGKDPQRSYPMGQNDFRVPGFNYANADFNSHVKGHLIDHKDTMQIGPTATWSTYDLRNYIPEPPEYEWGLKIRNQQVGALRRMPSQTAYAQIVLYPGKPLLTINRTPVPEGGYFISFNVVGDQFTRLSVFDVTWGENMKRPNGTKVLEHANQNLTSSLAASPVVQVYSPEDTDRAVRYQLRDLNKTANAIADGTAKSRNPQRAEDFPRVGAADKEIEHSNNNLTAAITANRHRNIPAAHQYTKRSLFQAEKLQEGGEASPFSKDISQQGLLLFQSIENDSAWGDAEIDVESLTDQFRGLNQK